MPDPQISILLRAPGEMPYSPDDFDRMLSTLTHQSFDDFEIIVYGDNDRIIAAKSTGNLKLIHTASDSQAEAMNVALGQAHGRYILLCDNRANAIEFRGSALRLYTMAAERHANGTLLYSDYDLLDGDRLIERKLLEHHPGRLCETFDMGYCLLFSHKFLQSVGYADGRFRNNPLYDLRLKASKQGEIIHISNRSDGAPYLVRAAAKGMDVFAYLKTGVEIARENELILTEYLKRVNAYLEPGRHYQRVVYTAQEEKQFEQCIASVVIPVYRRPEFIGSAIASVQSQTVRNIEIVVVCNGGHDDPTVTEAKRYMPGGDKFDSEKPPVRLIVHDINNIGLCLNSALQTSKAKYYIQLDSDDQLFPDAVEKILAAYKGDDRIGMVIGSYQVFEKKADGSIKPVLVQGKPFIVTHDEWTEENGRNNLLRIGGAGAPRSITIKVLEEMGWFGMNDSPYSRNYGEDYELVNKVAERYRIERVWEPIYRVVRHAGGTDHQIDQATIDLNENAKDHIRWEAIKRRQLLNKRR
jgi:glycosyltransferase involved in cell wall biosynthesis